MSEQNGSIEFLTLSRLVDEMIATILASDLPQSAKKERIAAAKDILLEAQRVVDATAAPAVVH